MYYAMLISKYDGHAPLFIAAEPRRLQAELISYGNG